ncbi:glutamate [NMDA] receptor subunit 1-like [Panulirus ornatus]|uniref:glutamate [NMDA] receptor subunit 1-like n=1 Tax=Panulirus ornatus TaxID=150431 RepID=UPI003A8A44DF
MPPSPYILRVLWLLAWPVVGGVRGRDAEGGGLVNRPSSQVETIVGQVVERHLARCHLVLATTTDPTPMFSSVLRHLAAGGQTSVVVEVGSLFSQEQPGRDHLLQGLWGNASTNCRALILHVNSFITAFLFRFLESSALWLQPDTPVVVIGGRRVMDTILHHASLRNTIHVLYLSLDSHPHPHRPHSHYVRSEAVEVFRRCLYCKDGQMGIHLLQRWNLSSSVHWDGTVFSERLENLMGQTLKVVALEYFPFVTYEQENVLGPDDLLTPVDSLDSRVLTTIASHLNFTYELREPWDGAWGVPLAGGNWSGIVGTLQYEQADFSLNLTPSPERLEDIAHSIIYSYDPLFILSLKPGTLPRYLALMRPYADDVWVMIIVFTSLAGLVLWLLQKTWSSTSGLRFARLDSTIFYMWGVLLQDPPNHPPTNISGQVFVGWWLLSCLVMTTAYQSSLIAHLSVQSKYPPINTYEDVLSRDGWSWGSHELVGTTFLHFNRSSDPATQELYRSMQTYKLKDGVERVLGGAFSYVTWESYIKIETPVHYSGSNTPFHVSTTEYPVLGGNSWGFRKGAPFLGQIRRLKQRLVEAGLIDWWTDDVINNDVRNKKARRGGEVVATYTEVNDGQMVLGLTHLQGVVYLLLLGNILAFMTFLTERLIHQIIVSGSE